MMNLPIHSGAVAPYIMLSAYLPSKVLSVDDKVSSQGAPYKLLTIEVYRRGKYETLSDKVGVMCFGEGDLANEVAALSPGDLISITANMRFHEVSGENAVWLYVRSVEIVEKVQPVGYNPEGLDAFAEGVSS